MKKILLILCLTLCLAGSALGEYAFEGAERGKFALYKPGFGCPDGYPLDYAIRLGLELELREDAAMEDYAESKELQEDFLERLEEGGCVELKVGREVELLPKTAPPPIKHGYWKKRSSKEACCCGGLSISSFCAKRWFASTAVGSGYGCFTTVSRRLINK